MPTPPWIKPKYRNKPTEYNGRRYASKAEAFRAEDHVGRCKIDKGAWVIPQVRINIASIPYTLDFLCGDEEGVFCGGRLWRTWAEDVKGMEKQRDRDIQRLWAAGHGLPMPLAILKRKGNKWERKLIEPKLGC